MNSHLVEDLWCNEDGKCSCMISIPVPVTSKSEHKDYWPASNYQGAHVTILFLGHLDRYKVQEVKMAMRTFKWPSFYLEIQGFGVFNSGEKRVLYFVPKVLRSVYSGPLREPGLQDLHYAVLRHVEDRISFEIEREHDFVPHVTWGYYDKDEPMRLDDFDRLNEGMRPWRVDALNLVLANRIELVVVLD